VSPPPNKSAQKKRSSAVGILLAVLGVLVALALGGFFLVKRAVRQEIEQQCSAALQGTCAIDDLSASSEGATANGIHLQAKLGLASGEIESIAVQLAWWPLLTGARQGITVRVVAPKLSGGVPIGNVVHEAQRMGEGLSVDKNPSRVRLDALTIERGDVRVSIPILADVHVDAIAAEWKRDGHFSLQWKEASFETILDSERTGECTITDKKGGTKVHVACGKRSFDVDVDQLDDLTDLVKLFLKAKK
jgi:hypothetical protein